MTLSSGTPLGPYEIVALLGAGGMGEVYRARDERLKRDVAVKVLPSSFAQDPERLRRFEQEAQTAGGLNHPNITSVFELGSHEGSPYIVTELLEGETLRGRLAGGAIPVRKATDYAIQVARGLAAAHEKGIVHRDLKPENLFVTNDGRVKILDFGLAKLTQADGAAGPQTSLPTVTGGTEPGVVLGTLGYMSPEQVKGKKADPRSDIFSFGAILYEMLSGSRAFHRDSAAETMSAILREEPPDLSATNRSIAPGLERVVRHCLEKNPEERFHSAHDLAFDLEALSGTTGASALPAVSERGTAVRRRAPLAVAAAAVAAALLVGYLVGSRRGSVELPTFHQLTFRRGSIWGARFGSDGKSILTSAAWDGRPSEIYLSRPESPESRSFGLPGADIAAVSPSGDLAVLLKADFDSAFTRSGTLARVGATGGAPRELLEKIEYADWSPDGKDLAVVRCANRKCRLEYPPGKILYETTGWIGDPRFSPRGDRIAFLDHPTINDDGGSAAIVDLSGRKTTVSPVYASAQGLAWSPDGSEVWFTAAEVGGNRSLHAASPSGKVRTICRVAGILTLHDTARDGRILMSQDTIRVGLTAHSSGAANDVDLTWLDWSLLADISPDGRWVLFSETGEGGGKGYSVYMRNLDGSPAVRLGEGNAQSISPDGKRVLALVGPPSAPEIVIYPTGAGEATKVPTAGLALRVLKWLPDGRHFLASGREPGHPSRTYLFDTGGGKPRPLTPEGYAGTPASLDGRRFVATGPDGTYFLCSIDGGTPEPIPGLEAGDTPVAWAPDGRLYAQKGGETVIPMRIVLHDPATGREEPFGNFVPSDASGVSGMYGFHIAGNGAWAYSTSRTLSELFLVGGVR
jgi:Tol biopolymer transport system component